MDVDRTERKISIGTIDPKATTRGPTSMLMSGSFLFAYPFSAL